MYHALGIIAIAALLVAALAAVAVNATGKSYGVIGESITSALSPSR